MLLQKKKKEKPALPPNLKPKKVIKPNNKMRNLHWTTVNPFDVEKTIWNKIDDGKIAIDVAELETKFCWKQIAEKSNTAAAAKSTPEKPKNDTVRVLDTRRAYNIEIFLGRLKMDPWTLREALLSMSETKLSLDTVHKLINFVPTKEEAAQLNGYENEKNLGVAENFVKIVRTVDTSLVERLKLWAFKIEFADIYSEQQASLVALRRAHDAVKKADSLQLMFSIILCVGNYMNGSTAKGQAYGFKLASLTQLSRSRTVDNSATLTEYLYEFILKHERYKSALTFMTELQCLEQATTVDTTVLKQNIAGINAKLKMIQKRIDSFNDKTVITRMGDNFYAVMQPFHTMAIQKFHRLEKQRDEIFVDLNALGVWLNEPKDATFKYLKALNEFRLSFKQSIKLYNDRKTKLAEIEKRKKWKEKQAQEKLAKKKKSVKAKEQKMLLAATTNQNGDKSVNAEDSGNMQKMSKNKDENSNANIAETQAKSESGIKARNSVENKDEEEDEDMDVLDEEQEQMFFEHNRKSLKARKMNSEFSHKTHNTRDKNISDLVLKRVVAGSSRSLFARLKNRARFGFAQKNK